MPFMLSRPWRRLRRKTWCGFEVVEVDPDEVEGAGLQVALCYTVEEELDIESNTAKKSVYLVTLPALKRVPTSEACPALKCPSSLSHEDIAGVIHHVFQWPLQSHNNASWGTAVGVDRFVIFRERHAPRNGETTGPYHWHVALRASASFRFAPYKRALSVNHGLASHWSCSHTGYWSAVRYGFMPSCKKKQDELDLQPFVWARDGNHPSLFDASQEPSTVCAMRRRRETKVLAAANTGKPEPRPTEMDLYPVVVRNGFRNNHDDYTAGEKLIKWLKQYASPALFQFAFKNRQKLSSLIDDVWSWETVDDYLLLHGQSRLDLLRAAARTNCSCGGAWYNTACWTLRRNGIDIPALCKDVLKSLRDGRREDTPVIALMGRLGGEGKSFFLSPLQNVFGLENMQMTPQPGSFPLLGLERKKVVLLDDWVFDDSVLSLSAQLLWYEGKAFPVTRPQNKDYSGHLLYKGTAPIFATCKEKDLGPLMAKANWAASQGRPSEHTMLLRRLKVYTFHQPFRLQSHISECPSCFARLVLECGV